MTIDIFADFPLKELGRHLGSARHTDQQVDGELTRVGPDAIGCYWAWPHKLAERRTLTPGVMFGAIGLAASAGVPIRIKAGTLEFDLPQPLTPLIDGAACRAFVFRALHNASESIRSS